MFLFFFTFFNILILGGRMKEKKKHASWEHWWLFWLLIHPVFFSIVNVWWACCSSSGQYIILHWLLWQVFSRHVLLGIKSGVFVFVPALRCIVHFNVSSTRGQQIQWHFSRQWKREGNHFLPFWLPASVTYSLLQSDLINQIIGVSSVIADQLSHLFFLTLFTLL